MPVLRLNRNIYNQQALDKAIAAYQQFAKITYRAEKDYFEINFTKIDPQVAAAIHDEFGNFVLGLMS